MPVVSCGGEHDTCHMTADPRRRGRQISGACSVEWRMHIPVWLRIAFGIAAVAVVATGCVSRVHPHVYLPPLKLGEPSFFPTLEAYTASPIVGGNTVDLLLNGDEIFPALVQAIRSARKTITYAQYYYEDGPVAREMAEAVAERCRAGVGANVLLDAFGTLNMPAERSEEHTSELQSLAYLVCRLLLEKKKEAIPS